MAKVVCIVQVSSIAVKNATIDDEGRVTFNDPEFAETLKGLKEAVEKGDEGGSDGAEALFNINCRCSSQ